MRFATWIYDCILFTNKSCERLQIENKNKMINVMTATWTSVAGLAVTECNCLLIYQVKSKKPIESTVILRIILAQIYSIMLFDDYLNLPHVYEPSNAAYLWIFCGKEKGNMSQKSWHSIISDWIYSMVIAQRSAGQKKRNRFNVIQWLHLFGKEVFHRPPNRTHHHTHSPLDFNRWISFYIQCGHYSWLYISHFYFSYSPQSAL